MRERSTSRQSISATNEKIQKWNQAYQELASAYMQVEFVPVFDSLTEQEGQLKKRIITTDGLHLSIAGYQALTKAFERISFLVNCFPFCIFVLDKV